MTKPVLTSLAEKQVVILVSGVPAGRSTGVAFILGGTPVGRDTGIIVFIVAGGAAVGKGTGVMFILAGSATVGRECTGVQGLSSLQHIMSLQC